MISTASVLLGSPRWKTRTCLTPLWSQEGEGAETEVKLLVKVSAAVQIPLYASIQQPRIAVAICDLDSSAVVCEGSHGLSLRGSRLMLSQELLVGVVTQANHPQGSDQVEWVATNLLISKYQALV